MPLVVPQTAPPSAEEVQNMSVEDKKNALMVELADKTVTEEPTSETNIHKNDLIEKYGKQEGVQRGLLRVVPKGGAMTRDFRQGRISVHLDEDNKLAKFSDN